MPELTMIEAIRGALAQELERDERVMLLGQDIGRNGGVFRATEGLQQRFGPERVVDAVLAEGVIVGSTVGLAISGMVPVAEIQFLGFANQAFHQISDQVSRYRFRSQGRYPMPITIRAPFGGGVRTPELHSDAKGLLTTAIRDEDPVLFCEPLRGYRLVKDEVPEGEHLVPFGRSRLAREGDDLVIIAWSAAVQLALRSAETLQAEGISAAVLDLRTLVPLDVDGLAEAVAQRGRAVVVHEAPLTGGFGAEVVATVQEEAFWSLEAPVARVTAPDTPYPIASIEELYIPGVERVCAAARAVVHA